MMPRPLSLLSGGPRSVSPAKPNLVIDWAWEARARSIAAKVGLREEAQAHLAEQTESNARLTAELAETTRLLTEAEQNITKLRADMVAIAAAQAQGWHGMLDEQMESHRAAYIQVVAELAGERATVGALRAEIERQTQVSMMLGKLEQAIRAQPNPQPIEPPVYDMKVVARDVNSRADRIRLTPVKEK